MKVAALFSVGIAYIALGILAFIGWNMNLVAVFQADYATLDGIEIARLVGVVIGPLGAVLGWAA